MLGLRLSPLHGGLLLSVGALAVLACLAPRAALIFSVAAAWGWATLTVVCVVEVAHHAPGMLGFDSRDICLYAALSGYNTVLSFWLTATVLTNLPRIDGDDAAADVVDSASGGGA